MKIKKITVPFLIIILTFLYLYFLKPRYAYFSDDGVFGYGARRILNGDILYKDFYDIIGPLNHYFLAFLYYFFGINIKVNVLITITVFSLIAVLMYLLAKKMNLSELFSILSVLFFVSLIPTKFFLYSHHWLSTMTILLSVLFFLKTNFFISGFFTGITLLFFYPKGLFLIAGGILSVALLSSDNKKGRIKFLYLFLIGAFLPLFAFSVYFYLKGCLKNFIFYGFLWSFKNYSIIHGYPAYYYPQKFALSVAYHNGKFLNVFISMLPVLFLGYNFFISTGVCSGLILLRGKRFIFESLEYIKIFIFTSMLFLSTLYRPDDLRLAFISPFTYLFFMGTLKNITEHLQFFFRNRRIKLLFYTILLAIPVIFSFFGFALNIKSIFLQPLIYEKFKTPGGTIFVSRDKIPDLRYFDKIVSEYNINEIFVYHCVPSFYSLWGLKNPTKFNCAGPHYNSPQELMEIVNELKKENVKFVLYLPFFLLMDEQYFPSFKNLTLESIEKQDPVVEYLKNSFIPVFKYGYLKKRIGEGYQAILYKKRDSPDKD